MAELKEVIWTDEASYNRFSKLQNEAKQTFEKLKAIHKVVLEHDIQNYKEYLTNSLDYLVNEYFEANRKYYPKNADRYKIFHVVDVEMSDIKYLSDRFNNLCKEMREYKPILNASGIQWKVNRARFEHVLDNAKDKHHKALKTLLECVKEVEKYEENFNRSAIAKASQNITFSGLDLVVINQNFI